MTGCVIGLRGMRSCRGSEPDAPLSLRDEPTAELCNGDI